MSAGWAGSDRRDRLPRWWPVTVRRIIARDPVCCCEGCPKCLVPSIARSRGWPGHCGRASQEVDHIERGDDHKDTNLRGICRPCHGRKSSLEGLAAREEKKAPSNFFEEKRPGALW